MDIEKAIEYLTPIYNSASLEGYQAALGAVLDAARARVEAEKSTCSIGQAIQDVQDMIDVLDLAGSAYVYRHNGGRERLTNILACLNGTVRNCQEVEFGSYLCYAKVPDYDISCDKCLATEIRMLNDLGIRTIGCCCGHMRTQGYIQVEQNSVFLMEMLSYQQLPEAEDGSGKCCFAPKSVLLGKAGKAGERNEPLTLEELLQMQGQPVWVRYAGGNWGLVRNITDDTVIIKFLFGDCLYSLKEYGDRWVAYRYPPAKRAAT